MSILEIVFLLVGLAVPWDQLKVWFLVTLGVTYAFHLTLTLRILKTRQTDITDHGYVFSASIILLGNLLVLVIAIPLLSGDPPLPAAFVLCWEEMLRVTQSVRSWVT